MPLSIITSTTTIWIPPLFFSPSPQQHLVLHNNNFDCGPFHLHPEYVVVAAGDAESSANTGYDCMGELVQGHSLVFLVLLNFNEI